MAREIYCHATNLFFEARGEIPLGQRWVLDVVKNRVNSKMYPDTYCGVVTQPRQFSWYNDKRYEMPSDPILWEEYLTSIYHDNFLEMASWRRSLMLAMDHFLYKGADLTDGSHYYMTVDVFIQRGYRPFPSTVIEKIIGNHIFFKPCENTISCYRF